MLLISHESHLDHGLTVEQVAYILDLFKGRNSFFIETFNLPRKLGEVPCALYGPIMGDPPVAERYVHYASRGGRKTMSRLVNRKVRMVNLMSVIAGPHGDLQCLLYTAFGGPVAPREPGDPGLQSDKDIAESEAFWSEHALAVT